MAELKLYVPTYYGDTEGAAAAGRKEFDEPHVPVLVRRSDGVRIVLGSHDYFDNDAPDVQIERRANGWAVFLHPLGGGDPSGCVYFIDDGRSFLVTDSGLGGTPACEVSDWDTVVAEVDRMGDDDARL
jgi:hypothetical protein